MKVAGPPPSRAKTPSGTRVWKWTCRFPVVILPEHDQSFPYHDLDAQYHAELRATAGVLVHADADAGPCSSCGGPMHVQKTTLHGGRTLAHGTFQVNETIHICAAGCTKPSLDGKPVRALIRRQPGVAALLLPRSSVGYDVMTCQ